VLSNENVAPMTSPIKDGKNGKEHDQLERTIQFLNVVFLHIRYDRYIITMMSVPYIGNIW
jgi:hypothetical protein